ncbi:DUF6473 family protein [Psychromarinibacter halotolerans]|uniref:DUF6473 family protein n=1 Tax=Psychromarinibacter halotolerans TaxID=1775175 RepID=A0ABV7GXE6_9RHOB|nr:DUF6473 family protein [Psychromarinibacter halotolerans]MDF0598778.1 DUF6473 family protein [Psychromarinibacter halotolerans]
MNYGNLERPALDYFPCRYGASKQLFRGPRRRLEGDFVAYLGGTETYGKFIDTPFPALVEVELGIRGVNLGCINAGIDAYFNDKTLLEICNKSQVAVMQVMGAQNMSNRFYAVHPRRNDRFLRASTLLHKIYPEVDFTEFSFTRHMLQTLKDISPEKFAMLRGELKEAWLARMRMLLSQIERPVVLLWLSDHPPLEDDDRSFGQHELACGDPLFIDRPMLMSLEGKVTKVVEVVASAPERRSGMDEMHFAEGERAAAEEMLGPVVHRRAARALAPVLKSML